VTASVGQQASSKLSQFDCNKKRTGLPRSSPLGSHHRYDDRRRQLSQLSGPPGSRRSRRRATVVFESDGFPFDLFERRATYSAKSGAYSESSLGLSRHTIRRNLYGLPASKREAAGPAAWGLPFLWRVKSQKASARVRRHRSYSGGWTCWKERDLPGRIPSAMTG